MIQLCVMIAILKVGEKMATKVFNCLDLFCGAGGLSKGFELAGFHIVAGIDFWKDALTTFERNHKDSLAIQGDMQSLDPAEVAKVLKKKKVDVICGGPPCQGFSIAGKRIVDDKRNSLYKGFVRFVEYFSPSAFVMENVPNILSIGEGVVKESILQDFNKLGYTVTYKILNAADYGVPQARRRTFFVGLKGKNFSFPLETQSPHITIKDAISDLPEQSLPDGAPYPEAAKTEYQMVMRKNSDGVFNHEITVHSEKTKSIIAMVPDGGNYKDLPESLQNTRKVHIAWTRYDSTRPSYTIDTGHFHHFHYEYNRVPTARESARIQSFPDDYVFLCGKTSKLKQVGNAVPPLLGYAVANQLKGFLK